MVSDELDRYDLSFATDPTAEAANSDEEASVDNNSSPWAETTTSQLDVRCFF